MLALAAGDEGDERGVRDLVVTKLLREPQEAFVTLGTQRQALRSIVGGTGPRCRLCLAQALNGGLQALVT